MDWNLILPHNIIMFFIKAIIFVIMYVVIVFFVGLSAEEKQYLVKRFPINIKK